LLLSGQTGREEWCEVKLDPEEHIIAAALDQAELDDASECTADARIEFKREGYAEVTIAISPELVDQATCPGVSHHPGEITP
jgi:hypothetical protein